MEALTLMQEEHIVIEDGMSVWGQAAKRTFDCALAAVLLIVFSPLFLICYIAVRLEDGAPAIFKQERIGLNGKPFYIYKFRSMRIGAEKEGPRLFAGDKDNRLTRTGKFLRDHHLDELPQLWNVFVGDMAFIGPRPERKFYIDKIMECDPRYAQLYKIRPGVTSYATLYNGYTDTLEKMLRRLELDLYYLEHRSWIFDMKILWQTFYKIVSGNKF
ncbi:MAG: sugar transferase [Bacteroidales bacterium]|nr:sugar transferase [Bacteroidales bacterium]